MKLNKNNYYSQKANIEFMSYSQFKDFCECPAMAMAKIKGEYKPETSDSMLVGSYVDAFLDNDLDNFKIATPEIFTLKGELKSQFKKAEEICEIIKNDKYLHKLLSGKRQKILICNIADVKFKTKLDSLLNDFVVDGKVVKDCDDCWIDGEKKSFIFKYRYDLQAAIYLTAVLQNYNKKLPFVLAVVTKETVPDKRIFRITDETVNNAMQEIIVKAPIFDDMKKGKTEIYGCGKCDYCKSIKKLNENNIEEI